MVTRVSSARMHTDRPPRRKRRLRGAPVPGKAGVDSEDSLVHPHTEKSEGEGLPDAAHGGQVEALRGGAGSIIEVEAGGHSEQLEGLLRLAGPSQERRMDGRGQRAAVGSPGPIEVQAGSERFVPYVVRHQMVEHEHVSLFDDLRSRDPVGTEQEIGGHRRGSNVGHDQGFEVEIAGELLVQSPLRAPPVDQPTGEVSPAFSLIIAAGPSEEVGAVSEVPPRHHVGIGIVVDSYVVLIGPHDPVNMTAPADVGPNAVAQSRAVSTTRSRPDPVRKASSPVHAA